jgi:hypothetical protein
MMLLSWFLLGAGAWFISVALKIGGDVAFQRNTTIDFHDWVTAVLSGLWSALCELGLAAIAFAIWRAGLWDAVAFAVGAAASEFLLLLPLAISGGLETETKRRKDAKTPAKPMTWRNFTIERVLALVGHVGSRLLLWVGVGGGGGLLASMSAFGLHALAEASAAYGEAKDWDWLKPRVMWPFFIFQTLIVVGTIWLAVWWSGMTA